MSVRFSDKELVDMREYAGPSRRELIDEIRETRATIESLAVSVDAARRAMELRGTGGQQVSFHGDFCNASPSVLGRLDWWIRALRGAK